MLVAFASNRHTNMHTQVSCRYESLYCFRRLYLLIFLVYQISVGKGEKRTSQAFFFVKNAIIFLPINLNMCFRCSKEPSH